MTHYFYSLFNRKINLLIYPWPCLLIWKVYTCTFSRNKQITYYFYSLFNL